MGYKDIDIPEHTDPEDYSYQERRAELFNAIIQAGHPDLISRTQFADRYGVDVSTVTRDIHRIRDEIKDEMGTDAEFIVYTVFQKGIRALARREDWEAAMDYAKEWGEWLLDLDGTGVEKAADRHEVDADIRQAAVSRDTRFQVVLGGEDQPDVLDTMEDYDEGELGFAATPDSEDDELADATAIPVEEEADD